MSSNSLNQKQDYPLCNRLRKTLAAISWDVPRLEVTTGLKAIEPKIRGLEKFSFDERLKVAEALGESDFDLFPEYGDKEMSKYPVCTTLLNTLERRGMSKQDLALEARIQYPNMCGALRGNRRMGDGMISKICSALGGTRAELFPELVNVELSGRQYTQVMPIGVLKLTPPQRAKRLLFQLYGGGGAWGTLDGSVPKPLNHGFYYRESKFHEIYSPCGVEIALLRETQGVQISYVWLTL